MTTLKKITVEELRTLITEALNEDSGIEDASDQENEIQSDELAAAADRDEATNESAVDDDEVILERWRKMAGILKG